MRSERAASKIRCIGLIIAMCLVVGLAPVKSEGAQTVYDTFPGEQINPNRWKIFDDNSVLSVGGGFLHASGPPSYSYGNIGSTRTFRGDFTFILKYADFHTTATTFQGNCPQVSLQVSQTGNDGGDFIFLFRGQFQNGPTFFCNGNLNGSWPAGFSAPAATPDGSLKIVRRDRTITTYFNEGNGWTKLGQFDNVFDSDVSVQIGTYTGDNGTFGVSVPSLTYSGVMVTPSAVSGCIDIKDSALVGATVKLRQKDVPVQSTKTSPEGCYEFKTVVPGVPFTITIGGTVD